MSNYFFDTSALAKRYIYENGSGWVRRLCRPTAGHVIVISGLTTVEMVSQIVRRERENTLTAFQRELIINQFLRHRQQDYIVIDLDEAVLEWARDLLIRRSLKTLDALQLAGAFQMTVTLGIAPIFVCADKRLLNAAAAEGFPTDDPNYHP